MSGHGANPIFFNKKQIHFGRLEHSLTPHPSTSDNILFCLNPPPPPPPPPPLKVDVVSVSPPKVRPNDCILQELLPKVHNNNSQKQSDQFTEIYNYSENTGKL